MSIVLDDDELLVANPSLRRLHERDAFALLDGDRALRLTPATYVFLDQLREPRPLRAVLAAPTDEQRQAIAHLLATGVLLRAADLPPAGPPFLAPASPAFLGAPAWDPDKDAPPPRGSVVIVGAPSDGETLPSYPRGSARGPEALRGASQRLPLRRASATGRTSGFYDCDEARPILAGIEFLDGGDVVRPPGCARATWSAVLEGVLRRAGEAGALPVLIGGDHAVALPAIRAVAATVGTSGFGVLHVDAHSDLAAARDDGDVTHANVMRHVARLPEVKHILQLGLRGLLPDEQNTAEAPWETLSVARLRQTAERRLASLLRPGLPYYVSIDVDALDPSVAPGTPVPVAEGFLPSELRRILRVVLAGRRVLGIDLVELLPESDRPPITASVALEVLLETIALGSARPPGS